MHSLIFKTSVQFIALHRTSSDISHSNRAEIEASKIA